MTDRKLNSLVNEDKVRLAIKRLFTGAASQIVGEILQNARRAGARRVEFTTTSFTKPSGEAENKIRVRDDGSGVLGGVEGWRAMLCIAESSYQDQNVKMEDPLGIGLHALFACDQVHNVTIRSRGRKIEIDTGLWWTHSAYYSTWAERLTVDERDAGEGGLELEIECDPKFIEAATRSLTSTDDVFRSPEDLPARGYEGVIEIRLNGDAVDTSLMSRFVHREPCLIWEGEYLGNRLRIAHGPRSCVNWYGQAVEDHLLDGGFSYYLEVRTGTPLDLRSPTRQGVIRNGKREALRRFIIDKIFEAVNGAPIEEVKIEWARGLYSLDPERAEAEAKYYVAGKINNAAEAEFSSNEEFRWMEEEVKAYGREEVLLLRRGVTVEYQDEGERKRLNYQDGIETFVEDLRNAHGEPYELIVGAEGRLRVRELIWRPRNVGKGIFVDAGVFALSEEGSEPQEWHAVTGEVFTFSAPSTYDILAADPLVAAKDRYAWLRSYSPWAVFDPEGAEDRVSTCADSFEKSIDDVIMYEFPDMIAEPLSLSDLSGRLGGGRVTNIHVVWPEKGRPRLRVTNERGEETELKMI